MPVRLKFDENIPHGCVQMARERGVDVATVAGQGMAGWTDGEIWPAIKGEGRLLITLYRGFGDVTHYRPGVQGGVLVLRPKSTLPQRIGAFFARVLERVDLDQLNGCVAVADWAGMRVRKRSNVRTT